MPSPRVKAFFEILEFQGEPGTITLTLGVSPSLTWRAGERCEQKARVHDDSGWRLVSPLSVPHDLEEHAAWLLDQLPDILDLSSMSDSWFAQFSFVVEVQDEMPAMSFSVQTLSRIARLGASLDIDLYVFSAENWD